MKIVKRNKFVKIVIFEEKYITKKFINCLNDKSINKYLDVRKEKQSKKTAIKYFNEREKNRDYYLGILNNRNSLIGTITLRKINKKTVSIGFMIAIKKYFGTQQSKDSFIMALNFAFNRLNAKIILAKTEKKNTASNFNLMRNGFKMYQKTDKSFYFMKKIDIN
tara:strand:+ start:1182 stop:1673 length:492 start_codon:yes stop_codon:yes gene_type:complete